MRRALVALMLLAVPHLLLAPLAGAAAGGPEVSLDKAGAAPGEMVVASVRGFRATTVQIEVCGQDVTSSRACDVASGTLVATTGGAGSGTLTLRRPPVACPCQVRALGIGTFERADTPLLLVGAPLLPATASPGGPPERPSAVVSVAFSPPETWTRRVALASGLARGRDLMVTVRNTGTTPLSGAQIEVAVGRSADDARPVAELELPDVSPGTELTRTVEVPAAIGRYVVVGQVRGAGPGGAFGTAVTAMPVLALSAGVFVALVVATTSARLAARRLRRRARTPGRPIGQPWLAALAGTVATVGLGLVVHSSWTTWTDTRATATRQQVLLAGFASRPDSGAQEIAPTKSEARSPRVTSPARSARLGEVVSVIKFPALGTDATFAVVEGTGPDELRGGPGHYPGTAQPGGVGNSVVMGHSGTPGAPFDDVHTLAAGDTIEIDTAARTWTYRVAGVRRVPATATDVLLPVRSAPGATPTLAQLTVVTCAYDERVVDGRWVVEADLVPDVQSSTPGPGSA